MVSSTFLGQLGVGRQTQDQATAPQDLQQECYDSPRPLVRPEEHSVMGEEGVTGPVPAFGSLLIVSTEA